jgi:hypothetical protein
VTVVAGRVGGSMVRRGRSVGRICAQAFGVGQSYDEGEGGAKPWYRQGAHIRFLIE